MDTHTDDTRWGGVCLGCVAGTKPIRTLTGTDGYASPTSIITTQTGHNAHQAVKAIYIRFRALSEVGREFVHTCVQ